MTSALPMTPLSHRFSHREVIGGMAGSAAPGEGLVSGVGRAVTGPVVAQLAGSPAACLPAAPSCATQMRATPFVG